jgi:hypothetical protein
MAKENSGTKAEGTLTTTCCRRRPPIASSKPDGDGRVHLIDLLKNAQHWSDDDSTIYAVKPWGCGAEAIVINPAPDATDDIERSGIVYSYFLEAFIARDFLEDFAGLGEGNEASERVKCERLIRYAINDA